MKRLLPLLLLLLVTACGAAVGIKPHVAVGAGTLTDRFSLLTGTSGTVTLGAGFYALALTTTTSAGGTLTETPCGPDIASCSASPAVSIPAGQTFTQTFKGAPDEMGDFLDELT